MKQGTQKCGKGRRRRIQASVATNRAEGRASGLLSRQPRLQTGTGGRAMAGLI